MPTDRTNRVLRPGRWWIAGVAAALAVAVLLAAGFWMLRPEVTADPEDPGLVALGRTVYAEQCASCHGAELEGQPDWQTRRPDGRMPAPPHDESGHTWHHPDGVLLGIIGKGLEEYAPPGYESDMPAFGDVLSDREIRAVLAYIKSTWPPEIRERQERITQQAQR